MNFHLGDSNFSSAGDQADPGDNQERVAAEAFLSELSKSTTAGDKGSKVPSDDVGSARLTDYLGDQERSKSNLAFSFVTGDGNGTELKLAARIGAGNISHRNTESSAAGDPNNFYKQGGGARFSFQLHRTEA